MRHAPTSRRRYSFFRPMPSSCLSQLSLRLRRRIGVVEEGQSVITRPGFRVATRLVPRPLAELLAEFHAPNLLTDAVLRFARAHDQDPLRRSTWRSTRWRRSSRRESSCHKTRPMLARRRPASRPDRGSRASRSKRWSARWRTRKCIGRTHLEARSCVEDCARRPLGRHGDARQRSTRARAPGRR